METMNTIEKYRNQVIDLFLTQRVSSFGKVLGVTRSGKSLIASLYALMDNADPFIKDSVKSITIDLSQEMSEEDILCLKNNFAEVIRYCYGDDIVNSRSEVLTKDYIEIISRLSNISPNKRILLPLGEIGIAAAFPEGRFDIVETTELGRGLAHIISEALNLDVRVYSSMDDVPLDLYSKIIAIAPYYAKPEDDTISVIIEALSNHLAEEEDFLLLLPRRACYSIDWEPLREYLVKHTSDFLTSCLCFDIDQQHTVDVGEALMMITRHAPSGLANNLDKVILGDMTGSEFFFFDPIAGPDGLKVDSIFESIVKWDQDHMRAVLVANLDKGYNFLAARYFRENALKMKPQKAHYLKELRDIVYIVSADNYVETYVPNPSFRIISERCLSENYLSANINMADVPSQSTTEVNFTRVNGGYFTYLYDKVLIGKILGREEDETVGISDEVIHFQIKDANVCSLDYVLKELTADYVQRQVSCFTSGLAMEDRLSVEDFLSIQIVIPSLKEQNDILVEESKKGYDDKTRELADALEEFKEDMHMKKHAIGQTIFAVNNWMKLLKLARKEGNGVIRDNDIVGKKHTQTVSEIFDNLEATIKRLKTQISTLDAGYEMTPTSIGVGSYIMRYIDSHPSAEFRFINQTALLSKVDMPVINDSDPNNITVSDKEFVLRKGDDLYTIQFPAEALDIIFDNIIANACSHGFIGKNKEYYIRFRAELDGKNISILISNNGAPLHRDLDSNHVFKYGNTTSNSLDGHYGIGGYQIWKLMKEHNGVAEVISTPEEEFTVTYKLTFPISNLIAVL